MNDLTKGLLIGLAVSTAYFGAEFASQQAKIEKLKREERVSTEWNRTLVAIINDMADHVEEHDVSSLYRLSAIVSDRVQFFNVAKGAL